MEDIAGKLKITRRRIAEAAVRSDRNPEDVLLVAVSKTRSTTEILEAMRAGAVDFGENKVQELASKMEDLEEMAKKADISTKINWHMIGHLQRNKVKYIIDQTRLIHSVDSLRLAEEIDVRAGAAGRVMDILVQVNPAGEQSKSGVAPAEAADLTAEILRSCTNIRVRGLMTIAPLTENPEQLRGCFRDVKEIFDKLASGSPHERLDCKILSMGMTGDYEVAIEEGSNLVRVGTGIFGARDYKG